MVRRAHDYRVLKERREQPVSYTELTSAGAPLPLYLRLVLERPRDEGGSPASQCDGQGGLPAPAFLNLGAWAQIAAVLGRCGAGIGDGRDAAGAYGGGEHHGAGGSHGWRAVIGLPRPASAGRGLVCLHIFGGSQGRGEVQPSSPARRPTTSASSMPFCICAAALRERPRAVVVPGPRYHFTGNMPSRSRERGAAVTLAVAV